MIRFTMNARTIIIAILLGICATAFCHPHVFIDCYAVFHFTSDCIEGIDIFWKFDEMYSMMVIGELTNGDMEIDKGECAEIESAFIEAFGASSYHTQMLIDMRDYYVMEVENFDASISDERRLNFKFTVPIRIMARKRYTEVYIGFFDTDNYYALFPIDDAIIAEGGDNLTIEIAKQNKVSYKINFKKQ